MDAAPPLLSPLCRRVTEILFLRLTKWHFIYELISIWSEKYAGRNFKI